MRLKSDEETMNLPLKLYSPSEFVINDYKQQLFLGLFYGVLLLAGLIYLFFYNSLKNKAFLYYSLYVFSIALMQGALDGFVYQYILPGCGYINSRMVLISAMASNIFLLKYCEYFLNVSAVLPKLKKVYDTIYAAIAIVFVMVFVNQKTLELAYPISNLNGLLSLILILISLFTLRFKKIKVDNYFSIGIFFLVVGLLGFVMNNLGLFPTNFYTLNSSKFGSGFEVVFLSLSMTNLLKKLREQKEKSQELALKKSREINELKTFFMSNISHELRTPINAITGVVEDELDKAENAKEVKKQYQVIRNATVSLLSNVNDILYFEKIEKNELELKSDYFNPSMLLNQLSKHWESEAHSKGLEYSFQIDSDIPDSIIGDSDRLMQIVNNVLSNAVKFTHTGSISFKGKCIRQPNNIIKFLFRISDTGIGIDEENKTTVFDSFNQMRLNHKRQFGGVGLGLTIAKHLVDLFRETIKIESRLSKGKDVFIEIPLKESQKRINEATNPNSTEFNTPVHILVVEDNKLNRMVMRKILSGFNGVTFSVAENGKEALKALTKEIYDIILMDLQMPEMDGYETTKLIRNGEIGKPYMVIPIIAVTADAMQETKKRVLDIGMNDYMTKPVKKELLFKKIQHCVQSQ